MNLPTEYELIQMENRAEILDTLEAALIEKRALHSQDELPMWIGQHFDEEDAAASAKTFRSLVATIRSLQR